MAANSKIEWTQATWNPLRGCRPVSPGCLNCYAQRFAHRLGGAGQSYEGTTISTSRGPKWTGRIAFAPQALEQPLHWRTPRRIFVNSMSDLFHEDVPVSYIKSVFAVMARAHWHTFQVLTKRANVLRRFAWELPWPGNVWMGVSIESAKYMPRLRILTEVPAAVRFVSFEPLLGPVPDPPLHGIDWVIVGGESGPGARPVRPEWVRELRDTCIRQRTAFFFKQWGGVAKKRTGRVLDGRTWDEMPERPSAGQLAVGV